MKEWAYTFDPVSKAEWISQIETDLRQKSVDTLTSEWWPEEVLRPIMHKEDLGNEIVQLPGDVFAIPPIIVEEIQIEGENPTLINEKILDALRYGVQTIRLPGISLQENFNPVWLKGVLTDIITVQMECDAGAIDDLLYAFISTPEHVQLRIDRTNSTKSILTILSDLKDKKDVSINRLKFIYTFHCEGKWTEQVANILNGMLRDLDHWKGFGYSSETFFSMCVFNIHSDIEYFKQIIQTRTLYVVWRNICLSHGKEINSTTARFLETCIMQSSNETPNDFLVRASMSSLAASLAGVHAISIRSNLNENNPAFYTRINRNIHHLLHQESEMNKNVDPLAGAYAIDFYTKRWVNIIWANIVL